MLTPGILGGIGDYVNIWQVLGVIVLIGIIIFYVQYRKKQM